MATSQEDIKRAKTHRWVEANDQTEYCAECLLILPKATLVENIPACPGRMIFR